MNRLLVVSALATWLTTSTVAPAVEPHIDFVHGLRDRRQPDLALEYLQRLSKAPPPEIAANLPLEMARCRLDMALIELDPAKRAALYAQARDEFAGFLAKNPGSPLAPAATLELARITSQMGKAQYSLAMKQETAAARKTELLKARPLFQDASNRLAQATQAMAALLTNAKLPPADRKNISQDKFQADFELGMALFDLSQTFDDNEALPRSLEIRKALDILKKTMTLDDKNPLCWQARAWYGRCNYEIDDYKKAMTEYDLVIKQTGPQAEQAKRYARYFRLMAIDKVPDNFPKNTDLLDLKKSTAEEWLRDYSAFTNDPEGLSIRFQLAEIYVALARRPPSKDEKKDDKAPKPQDYYAKAEKLYEELERTPNEYAQQAHDQRLRVIIARWGDLSKKNVSDHKDFEECFIRARVEIGQMTDLEKKIREGQGAEKDKAKKEREKKNQILIESLTRALDLADATVAPADLAEARYFLSYALLEAKELYQAAILAEDMARSDPKSPRAAISAGYALEAYGHILTAESRKEDKAPDADVTLEAIRVRLIDLARFMEAHWPADPATNYARYELGLNAFDQAKDADKLEKVKAKVEEIKRQKYLESILAFQRITPTYESFMAVQFYAASAAVSAMKDGIKPPDGQPPTFWRDQMIAALRKMPALAGDADARTARYYVLGRIQLAQTLFTMREYAEMLQVTEDLQKKFPTMNLPPDFKAQMLPEMAAFPLLAAYGKADTAFQNGEYAEAVKVLDPIANPQLMEKIKDIPTVRGILGLALRANVREGKTKRAKEILDLLQKTAGDLEGTAGILMGIVQQLEDQVKALEKAGITKREEHKKTQESIINFLDTLSAQRGKSQDMVRFLAFSYSKLNRHDKSADLLDNIKPPPPAPKPEEAKKGETEEEKEAREKKDREIREKYEKDLAFYHAIRVMYARELREAKQWDKTSEALKKILKEDWGKRSLDAQKELIYLFEDQEQFGPALKKWDELMKMLRPRIDRDNRSKDEYFACYYHLTLCVYKNAMKSTDEAKKRNGIRQAATFIHKLETNKPDMGGEALAKKYRELLEKEKPLKAAYEDLKKAAAATK